MLCLALIVIGTMPTSPLVEELFLQQNENEESEVRIEQHPSGIVENPDELVGSPEETDMPETSATVDHSEESDTSETPATVQNPEKTDSPQAPAMAQNPEKADPPEEPATAHNSEEADESETSVEESEISEAPAPVHTCCFYPYSTLFAGGSYSYVVLKSTDEPQYSGNLWGVLAGYQYRKQDGLYAAVKALWRQGATNGELGQNYLHECKAEERVGYDFSFGPFQRGSVALYMGLGYRFMEQKIQQPDLPDVLLAYNNFYVPIGTSIDYAIPFENSCLSLGLCATWMPQIYPTVNIVPLGGARWIVEYELANGIIELPVTFSWCNVFSLTLRPLFEYWKDGATTAVGSLCDALGLPASAYLFGSVNLEFSWKF